MKHYLCTNVKPKRIEEMKNYKQEFKSSGKGLHQLFAKDM